MLRRSKRDSSTQTSEPHRKKGASAMATDSLEKRTDKGKKVKKYMEDIFGFSLDDLKSWQSIVSLLYRPTDPASLGVVRALFGLLMIIDIPEERGLSQADIRWGDSNECRFPLFNFLHPLPLQWMCVTYLIMWLGAVGIMLGLFFRVSCLAFAIPYWYIFLLDKSTWNNHSYLYGLFVLLMLPSQANLYCSLDSLFWPQKKKAPLWNYAILRYQLFILYFLAGLKKLDLDWLSGYSMTHLAGHWVFDPFRTFLTPEQVDFWIVHLGGFLLDLTIAFWLFFDRTRLPAMLFCGSFHLMNSQIFTIGMFPYVCLATLPLFCSPCWPRNLLRHFTSCCCITPENAPKTSQTAPNAKKKEMKEDSDENTASWRRSLTVILLATHVGIQAVLPYSHSVTKGYNNWTNGLYGYSWDMMVHTWNTILVMPRVADHSTGKVHYLDPEAWVQSDRWTKHTDMVYQWAHCVKRNLAEQQNMPDVSVYLDVWSSLNGRFQQRMYDPRVDLLTADWSPFQQSSWVMPLMTKFSNWRNAMTEIEQHVFSWSNYSDVLFVADFPGLSLENYIVSSLGNVSLTVLSGDVTFEQLPQGSQTRLGHEISLSVGQSSPVLKEAFHYIKTTSQEPSCYMYTFTNETALRSMSPPVASNAEMKSFGFLHYVKARAQNFKTSLGLVWNAVLHLVFKVPVPRRVRVG